MAEQEKIKDKAKRDRLKKELKDMEDGLIPMKPKEEVWEMTDQMCEYCPHEHIRDEVNDTDEVESWVCTECGCQDFRMKVVE